MEVLRENHSGVCVLAWLSRAIGVAMKVHKIVLTVVDFDELGADGVRDTLESVHYPNHCISPVVMSVETRDCGEWRDDHPLNNRTTSANELTRLFGA